MKSVALAAAFAACATVSNAQVLSEEVPVRALRITPPPMEPLPLCMSLGDVHAWVQGGEIPEGCGILPSNGQTVNITPLHYYQSPRHKLVILELHYPKGSLFMAVTEKFFAFLVENNELEDA